MHHLYGGEYELVWEELEEELVLVDQEEQCPQQEVALAFPCLHSLTLIGTWL